MSETNLLPLIADSICVLAEQKKEGFRELAGMAMLSLVSDARSEPLVCAPNELTGWTDSRFPPAMYDAAVARLQAAMAGEPSAVQTAVSAVLAERLVEAGLAAKMQDENELYLAP